MKKRKPNKDDARARERMLREMTMAKRMKHEDPAPAISEADRAAAVERYQERLRINSEGLVCGVVSPCPQLRTVWASSPACADIDPDTIPF